MQKEIIISGFGGQGVLLAGTIIAQSAIEQNLHTTWFPSYGAEMRGGTANSTVVISDEEIGSPLAFSPSALIALNEQSLDKFLPRLSENAVIIANSSMIPKEKEHKARFYYSVPATDIAYSNPDIKNVKAANMAAVGALIKVLEKHAQGKSGNLLLESLFKSLQRIFLSKPSLIGINKKAIQAGYDFIK
jgi:2-oxoglutarate ferredoxin oxidoreductase subunit gamma